MYPGDGSPIMLIDHNTCEKMTRTNNIRSRGSFTNDFENTGKSLNCPHSYEYPHFTNLTLRKRTSRPRNNCQPKHFQYGRSPGKLFTETSVFCEEEGRNKKCVALDARQLDNLSNVSCLICLFYTLCSIFPIDVHYLAVLPLLILGT